MIARFARIARMSTLEWKSARPAVSAFFENGWKHPRIERELEKRPASPTSVGEVGRRRGRSRRGAKKNEEDQSSDANGGSTPVEPEANPTPTESEALHLQSHTQEAADDPRASPVGKSLITPEAFTLSGELMRLQRIDPDDPRCVGMAVLGPGVAHQGLAARHHRATVEIVMSRRREAPRTLRFFEAAIAEAHAEAARPLPTAQVHPREPFHAKRTEPKSAADVARELVGPKSIRPSPRSGPAC